jgi:hypothetical protein
MTRSLFFTGIIILFWCSPGNAQMIYSNAFNGQAVNINGTAPTVANTFAGGSSSATWLDAAGTNGIDFYVNGNVGTAQGDSILLPFYPQPGYVYTLTASVTFSGDPGNWLGAGFAQYYAVPGFNNSQLNQSGVNGYNWAILTESSGNVQYFKGPSGSGPIFNQNGFFTAGPGTHTLKFTLDTTSTQSVIACYVDGVQVGPNTTNAAYPPMPPIAAIGVTQHTLTTPGNIHWNYLALQATGPGPTTNTVNATVSFSPANAGVPLNPAFNGLSYEKSKMTTVGFFAATNTGAIKLFSQIGPAVLRVAGGTVDTTGWNGISNTYPITASEVDALAGFMKALPTNWSVIYGINLLSNTPANCAAEAVYAANALGSRLLGFEVGNEPEYGFSTYSAYLARWRPLAAAITNAVAGWAATNNGTGWIFADTDAGQGQLAAYTDPFASDEAGVVPLLTQHYYRGGPSATNTIPFLLQPDPFLFQLVTNIVGAAKGHCPLGARITETGSFSAGGTAGVSDAYGAALWSLDFMFTMAENGGAGVNFHGGGLSPYSPLIDNGPVVTRVNPEFYGLKMFSLLPAGNVIPATVALSSNINFTAYGVRQANGAVSALLNNKEASDAVVVSVNLGPYVSGAQVTELTGPSLYNTSGYTIGGAAINLDGSWAGGAQAVLPATNGQLTVVMPPASAFLLNPVVNGTNVTYSLQGNLLTLSWPTNYTGWLLQSNSTGLQSANWFTVPGSGNTNRVQVTVRPGQPNVFYRLVVP